ncbi:MAG: TdeIII family type II restriction endonuclease, partial [Pelotomaculum sp.]|nr:TdeIII family type II restriction endonuclease [Pelotomaculum sp.]
DQMLNLWRENSSKKPSFPEMSRQAAGVIDESKREISIQADLYVKHSSGVSYFFEIKSPKPNKDQCLASMEKMLRLQLIKKGEAAQTFYVMPFNPYGTRDAYSYTFAKTYLDFENFVLLQEEFWDGIIGPPGTFQALVDIYRQTGEAVRRRIKSLFS